MVEGWVPKSGRDLRFCLTPGRCSAGALFTGSGRSVFRGIRLKVISVAKEIGTHGH